MRLFKRDTQPNIGTFDFSWTHQGYVQIKKLDGTTETCSVEALARMANSRGFSTEKRNMAIAALDWVQENPFGRIHHEYNTTPSL